MHIYTSPGIIIRKIKYLESDLIVTVFSKTEGKLKAIVKGGINSKKRFPGAFEVGNIGEFGFTEKSPYHLMMLNHAKINNYLIHIKNDYEKIVMLFYILSITDAMLAEHQKHQSLFDILVQTLQFLESNKSLNKIRLFYELHLLKETGLLPAIEKCELCGTPFMDNNVNYIIKTGKWVCNACVPNNTRVFTMPEAMLKWIKLVNTSSININEFLISNIPSSIFDVTTTLISNYIDKPLKIWQLVDNL
jgi:DNA repair protein RecO (recombination protein O)